MVVRGYCPRSSTYLTVCGGVGEFAESSLATAVFSFVNATFGNSGT